MKDGHGRPRGTNAKVTKEGIGYLPLNAYSDPLRSFHVIIAGNRQRRSAEYEKHLSSLSPAIDEDYHHQTAMRPIER